MSPSLAGACKARAPAQDPGPDPPLRPLPCSSTPDLRAPAGSSHPGPGPTNEGRAVASQRGGHTRRPVVAGESVKFRPLSPRLLPEAQCRPGSAGLPGVPGGPPHASQGSRRLHAAGPYLPLPWSPTPARTVQTAKITPPPPPPPPTPPIPPTPPPRRPRAHTYAGCAPPRLLFPTLGTSRSGHTPSITTATARSLA